MIKKLNKIIVINKNNNNNRAKTNKKMIKNNLNKQKINLKITIIEN